MAQIIDSRLAAIADGYSTDGLPKATARDIYRTAHLLMAMRSPLDLNIFPDGATAEGNRFVVTASGKWAISFVMGGKGPDELRLETRHKSCRTKPSQSSRRRRQGKS